MKTQIQTPITRASLISTANHSSCWLAGILVLGTSASHGADRFWSNQGSAGFNSPANWNGLPVPTRDDFAFINNGGTVQVAGQPDWYVADIRAGNPGVGSVVQDSGSVDFSGWMRLAVDAGSTGTYTLNDGVANALIGDIRVGEIGNGTLNVNGGRLDVGGLFAVGNRAANGTAVGTFNQAGGQVNVRGETWISNGATSATPYGFYNLSDGALATLSWIAVGRGNGVGANGELVMTGGKIEKGGEGSHFILADGGTSKGTMTMSAGTVNCGNEFWVGQGNANATGTLNLSGSGVINIQNWFAGARAGSVGVLNQSGGTINKFVLGDSKNVFGTGGGVFTYNLSGGTFNSPRATTWASEQNNSNCIWTISGTGVANLALLDIGNRDTASGTINLNSGGTLSASQIIHGSTGTATINFNGGTLKPSQNSPEFIAATINNLNVGDGGAIIDTNGYNIGLAKTLSSTGTGGLTKRGRGILTLADGGTVSGVSAVNEGTLEVRGSFAAPSLSVADGAGLAGDGAVVANVTLGNSTGAILVNDGFSPLDITGNLAANGSTVIDFAEVPLGTGTYDIVSYTGSLTGGANFKLGARGTISIATPNLVKATVSSPLSLTWTGGVDKVWDIKNKTNWNSGNFFAQGDDVTFGNVAAGTAISVVGSVRPNEVNLTPTSGNTITFQAGAGGDIAGNPFLSHLGTGKVVVGMDTSLTEGALVTINEPDGELQVGVGGTRGSLGQAPIGNEGTLSFNLSGDKQVFNSITGGGSIKKAGTGTVTLRNGASTGSTTVDGGKLVLRNPSIPGTGSISITGALELDNSGTIYNVTSPITGSGSLIKSGTAEVSLSGDNSGFTGPISVEGGPNNALNVFHVNGLGSTSAGTTVTGGNQNGGRHLSIRLLTGGTTINEPLTFNAGGFGRTGLRHEGAAQTLTMGGPIVMNSTGLAQVQFWNVGTSSALNLTGDISGSMKGAAFFLRGTTAPINITGSINLDAAEMVITDGTPVTLGGVGKTYSGFRTNIAFGSLRTLTDNALPPSARVWLGQNQAAQVSSLFLGRGSVPVTNTIGGIRSNTPNTNSRIAGGATTNSTLNISLLPTQVDTFGLPIGGPNENENNLNIVKSGGGRLNLTATSSYTGATTVSAGILEVSGSLAGTSGVAVQAGATLDGSGQVSSVTAAGAPGNTANINAGNFNAIGTLTAGAGTLGPHSGTVWQINDWTGLAGAGFDFLNVTGVLNVTATAANPSVIRVNDALGLANFSNVTASFDIATAAGGITNFAANKFVIDTSGFTSGTGIWSITQNGNSLRLTYTAAAGSAYSAWASSFGLDPNTDGAATFDKDKDGQTNGTEFALGGSPINGGNNAKIYSLKVDSNDADTLPELLMTIAVRTGTPAFTGSPSPTATMDGFIYKVQGSTSLASFASAVTPVAPVTTGLPGAPAGYEYRTFSLNGSNGLTTKGFLRVDVTAAP